MCARLTYIRAARIGVETMKLFRDLSPDEAQEFRQWARENYTPHDTIEGIWHPVVQAECTRMNEEAELTI